MIILNEEEYGILMMMMIIIMVVFYSYDDYIGGDMVFLAKLKYWN